MSTPSISVVLPVYRSAASLRPLVERLLIVLQERPAEFEIILINDGSPDRCWALIEDLARADPHIRGIDLMRNFGQHNALLCGIRAARFDVIVTLDADLQHPPEEIPKLLAKLAEGFDVVYGVPLKEHHNLLRSTASRLFRVVVQGAMGINIAFDISAFRAFRRPLRDAMESYRAPSVFIDVLLGWATTKFGAVEVQHAPRPFGRSSYSWFRLLNHCITIMTSFSTVPLRLASWIGFGLTLFGIGVLIYVVGLYLILGYSNPGFPFLASIIAIFSGAQLFALGIMGEYLARIHFRLMEKPPYVIRGTTGHAA
ncbi:MAG: glycosyltransferase family 2 protein [Verrucomicrobia bacterium]|nr:glycosyltransferase family 2 protein [Verrucomicrobiota bacterium]